jgi:hypothetical protein
MLVVVDTLRPNPSQAFDTLQSVAVYMARVWRPRRS